MAWLLAASMGSWALIKYESTPGGSGMTPENWPAQSSISWIPGDYRLVMFAHPQCPCTRASINELNRLLARCSGPVMTKVLFIQPGKMPDNWVRGSLWKSAAAIPGLSVQADTDGMEARRFGAETSGFTVLYAPDGRLLFKGGITPGRGHAGDSAGCAAIVSHLAGKRVGMRQTPVFGCGLLDCEMSVNATKNEGQNGNEL
jgi:hypothetical protein